MLRLLRKSRLANVVVSMWLFQKTIHRYRLARCVGKFAREWNSPQAEEVQPQDGVTRLRYKIRKGYFLFVYYNHQGDVQKYMIRRGSASGLVIGPENGGLFKKISYVLSHPRTKAE
jgi:hypothetical protein